MKDMPSPDRSRFVLFWDHIPSPSNPYDLAIFSQWFDAPFSDPSYPSSASLPRRKSTVDAGDSDAEFASPHDTDSPRGVNAMCGIGTPHPDSHPDQGPIYKTAEHWMMYHKARLFDPSLCPRILDAPTPAEAKKLGREVKGFDREVWNRHADEIVRRGNWAKFHPDSAPRWMPDEDVGKEQEEEQAEQDRVRGVDGAESDRCGKEKEDKEVDGEESGDRADRGSEMKGKGYERRKALAEKRWQTLKATKGKRMVEASPEDRIWGIGYGRNEAWDHTDDWGLNRYVLPVLVRITDVPT